MGATSSPAVMNPGQCRIEILHQLGKRSRQGRPPANKHIVMAGVQPPSSGSCRKPHDFAQPAPDPVALDGVADLPRHGEADTDHPTLVSASADLQGEGAGRHSHSARRSLKIAPAF